ncbi:MAG: methyltransferase domain-containing protein [Candidatus Binataceae bacterium]|nr:methyltransferase domain-containing protein [Candidatus Binataceae bacterium]
MGLHRETRRLRQIGVADYTRRLLKNRLVGLANHLGPQRYRCPCCGWSGARFLDYFGKGYRVKNIVCPGCGSQPRHRGLLVILKRELSALSGFTRVLHFAPEKALAFALAQRSDIHYFTSDLRMREIDFRADATCLPLRGESIEFVISSHILEHIQHDHLALNEIARVMAPGARALILVPMRRQWPDNAPTIEFGAPNPELDNHWRLYGLDLADRVRQVGLQCSIERLDLAVPQSDAVAYGLVPEPLFVAAKPATEANQATR